MMFLKTASADPNVQVILDSEAPVPQEAVPTPSIIRIIPPSPTPLVPTNQEIHITPPAPAPLLAPGTVQLRGPKPIPLISPEAPHMVPSATTSYEQAGAVTLSDRPPVRQYRVLNMPLNDFGVAMARKSGLNYIYNPAVKGTVNGLFHSNDPVYMLSTAAKANGYKLIIKDGVDAYLQKEENP